MLKTHRIGELICFILTCCYLIHSDVFRNEFDINEISSALRC